MSSHHGSTPNNDAYHSIGATGKFPQGKLNKTDEGELCFAIAGDPKTKKVLIEFGKSVEWLGLDPIQARGLAEILLRNADVAEGIQCKR